MATPETVQQKLLDIIDRINEVTGLEDTTVNTAVDSALKLKLEEAYGKYFSRFKLEEDQMYAIGYNWFADLVKLTQTMAFVNRDLTPEEILEVLGRVEYFPHIFIEELIGPQYIESIREIKQLLDEVVVETQKPKSDFIVQPFTPISINSNISIGTSITEEVSFSPVWVQNDIQIKEDLLTWNYNPRYVTLNSNGAMILQTQWNYESVEESIDQGHMTIVKAVTSDLTSVEEVTVSG